MNKRATAQMAEGPDFTELGRFLIALGDPTRQKIVMALSRERLNVNQLTERFPLSRPAMSHHLKVLSHGGLLVQERLGRERVYRVNVSRCRELASQLKAFISTCCAGPECC
jgi:ArsR family transcriptional regulator, arsenate/arsenite/antimonite-responsive transcriptional repressor